MTAEEESRSQSRKGRGKERGQGREREERGAGPPQPLPSLSPSLPAAASAGTLADSAVAAHRHLIQPTLGAISSSVAHYLFNSGRFVCQRNLIQIPEMLRNVERDRRLLRDAERRGKRHYLFNSGSGSGVRGGCSTTTTLIHATLLTVKPHKDQQSAKCSATHDQVMQHIRGCATRGNILCHMWCDT